jgi:hypothetical protein
MLKLTQSVSAKGATRYFDELGPRETIEMLPLHSCVCALQPAIRTYQQISPKDSTSGLLKP